MPCFTEDIPFGKVQKDEEHWKMLLILCKHSAVLCPAHKQFRKKKKQKKKKTTDAKRDGMKNDNCVAKLQSVGFFLTENIYLLI